jgi:hypothetical protein
VPAGAVKASLDPLLVFARGGGGFQRSAGNGAGMRFANGDNDTKYHITLDFTQELKDRFDAVVPMTD